MPLRCYSASRLRPDERYRLIKVSCDRGSLLEYHTHDYPEIFWIEEGRCRHRINGGEDILEAGDIVFIRIGDIHELLAVGNRRFTMVNFECHPGAMENLRQRHPDWLGSWFPASPPRPLRLHLKEANLRRLQQLALDFFSLQPDVFHFEAFCFDLARILTAQAEAPAFSEKSNWLQEALFKAQEPEIFGQGVAGLIQAAGRSAEHVARSCRTQLGQTPTELITERRMVHAERELRFSSNSIIEIALSCGYSTPAQFHRMFRKTFGRTPLEYRRWLRGA